MQDKGPGFITVYMKLIGEAKEGRIKIPYLYPDEVYGLSYHYAYASEAVIRNDILRHYKKIFDWCDENWKERDLTYYNTQTQKWEYSKVQK